nr:PREDICTED: carbonic anhydrase 9 [Anolis carolinensis]|eukprot:XP_008121466.1 PREDICTED: carbonic anhydrase 9 [Anolis carolinensis]
MDIVLDLPRSLSVSGGGFPFPLQAAQLHLHWGSQPGLGGSEHTVDGHRFAGELHVVHYDSRFGSFKEAAKEPGGLAVLAAFLQVGSEENAPYQHILEHLGAIQEEGQETLVGGFDVAQLLPPDLGRYFRYNGSLTTPPCFQTVNWTIFNQTLRLSPQQITVLEDTLRGDGDHPLHGNFRLPQDLYGRTVLASFPGGHSARRVPLPAGPAQGEGAPHSSPETTEKPPEEEGDGAASGEGGGQPHSPPEDASGGDPGPAPPEDGGSALKETPEEEGGHGMAPGEDVGQPRSPPGGTSEAGPDPAPPEEGSNRASGSGTAQQTASGIQAGGVLAILFGVLFGLTALAFFLYVRKHRKQRLAAQSGKPSVIYTPAAKTEENTV